MRNRWWRRIGLVVLIAGCAIGPLVLGTQAAGNRLDGAHWARKSTPFELRVGDNTDRDWNRYLTTAVADWNRVGVARMRVTNGQAGGRQNCPVTSGRVEVCSGDYGNTGWLGLARIELTAKSRHITGASVMMNDSYFRQNQYNDRTAKQHTICHELGHTLGLDHAKYPSCMNHSNNSVFNDAAPAAKDKRSLKRIYDHRDRETTVGGNRVSGSFFDPTTMPDLPDAGELGTTTDVYTEPLGNGRLLVTTITWINDADGR